MGSNEWKVRVQSLRLLTNLSTNEAMTNHILASKVPTGFWKLIDIKTSEDELLRAICLIANVIAADQKSKLSSIKVTNGDANSFDEANDNHHQILNLEMYGLECDGVLNGVLSRL